MPSHPDRVRRNYEECEEQLIDVQPTAFCVVDYSWRKVDVLPNEEQWKTGVCVLDSEEMK